MVQAPQDPFAQHVLFLLGALFKLQPKLSHCELVVVDCKHLPPAVQYDNEQFKVDRRWLIHDEIHKQGYCDDVPSRRNADLNLFTCDHVVRRVWDHLLGAAIAQGGMELDKERLNDYAQVKIQQVPRDIRYMTNQAKNEMVVSWISMESHLNSAKAMRVTLHSDGCTAIINMAQEMYRKSSQGKSTTQIMNHQLTECIDKRCQCPVKFSTVGSGQVRFTGRSPYGKYTAMISRNKENAIYGISPAAILTKDLPVEQTNPAGPGVNSNQISQLFTKRPEKGWSKYIPEFRFRSLED
jgi:hypothetical protein